MKTQLVVDSLVQSPQEYSHMQPPCQVIQKKPAGSGHFPYNGDISVFPGQIISLIEMKISNAEEHSIMGVH